MALEKAEERMQMRRAGWRSFLEQLKNFAFLFYTFTIAVALVVITWCTFTIQLQNKEMEKINRSIEKQTVYIGVMENKYKNMIKEFERLQDKLK